MAGLFDTVAEDYARGRPTYPSWWFSRLASLTPRHAVAWDVGTGTGNGQAAVALAGFYDRVIGTDVSEQQLRFAEKRPNVTYALAPIVLTDDAVDSIVGPEGSVDLVTVATAVHWFDLESFYSAVKRVLRKDGGVIAVWTYTTPRISPAVDAVYSEYLGSGMVHMDPRSHYAFEEYKTLPFPFDPVLEGGSGVEGNPESFEMEKEMAMGDFLAMMGSSAALGRAREEGVEMLNAGVVQRLKEAWGAPHVRRTVTYRCFALVGTVKSGFRSI